MFVVINTDKFNTGKVKDAILSTPKSQKEAEMEAAWLEHLMGWASGTTQVIPFANIQHIYR
jgi:hypothetical protein